MTDLPPVCHWLDLLMLAERLAPQKPLVPLDCGERVTVLGLSALIAGVDGFGWNRRLQMLAPMMALDEPPAMIRRLADKYGWSEQAHAAAPRACRPLAVSWMAAWRVQQAQGVIIWWEAQYRRQIFTGQILPAW